MTGIRLIVESKRSSSDFTCFETFENMSPSVPEVAISLVVKYKVEIEMRYVRIEF